jgi:glycoside/pentoside/hexuronide:cation symporter, GPH family
VYVIAVVAGIGFSAQWVFPWAMVPDVVEHDRLQDGRAPRRDVLRRLGPGDEALRGAGHCGHRLGAAALWLRAQRGAERPHLLGIRLFFGPLPLLFFALALPLLIFYPITRRSHAELRKKLEAAGR